MSNVRYSAQIEMFIILVWATYLIYTNENLQKLVVKNSNIDVMFYAKKKLEKVDLWLTEKIFPKYYETISIQASQGISIVNYVLPTVI